MKHVTFTKIKRLTALILALLLVASLAGCKKKENPDGTGDSQNPPPAESTSVPTDPPVETTSEPTEAPTVSSIEDPTEPEQTEPEGIRGTITASELNIREEAGSNFDSVGSYHRGDEIVILEIKGAWGRTDKGWISMNYVKLDKDSETEETQPEDEEIPENEDLVTDGKENVLGYGVVTIGSLNVRTGPGSKYDDIGDVSLAERYPYYQESGNWVRLAKGWVSKGYFYIEGTTGEGAGTGVIINDDLNVRKGPGTDYERVDGIREGEDVRIYAVVNNWGYTGKGWISMHYVEMEGYSTDADATVTVDVLNIRKEPDADSDKVGAYEKGDKIVILEVKGDWGRTDKGWVKLDYVRTNDAAEQGTTGTVTADTLYIRKKADKNSDKVGYYDKGDKVTILETKGDWGRTNKGWIHLDYVKLDKVTGTVTASSLFIRKEPDQKSEDVGYYEKGDKVTILEIKGDWGRTDKGWIHMDYVKIK